MLARLDQDLGPLRSSVNREGDLLRVHGPAGVPDLAVRVLEVVAESGYIVEPLETIAAVPRWFEAAHVDELSQEEAHVLAERWGSELAAEGIVEHAERVIGPLRAALFDAFREAARTGSMDDVRIDGVAIRNALGGDEATRVIDWIEQKLGRPHSP